jgi:formamidopyrimidine-DNA glycosylase
VSTSPPAPGARDFGVVRGFPYDAAVPERPDLEYVVPILDRELGGARISGVIVTKPVVLRVALRDPVEVVIGRSIRGVSRRAHFVLFALDGAPALEVVVSPMLAGRFVIARAETPKPADLAFTLALEDGREVRYRDDVQMGKVYVIEAGRWAEVPGLASIGVDVLDPGAFTREAFHALAKKRRDQAKVFLMDKQALDAMGNAYADEVLFEARIHPKTMVRSLSDEAIERLRQAIVTVLGSAREEIARRRPPTDEKVRDFLKVRNRHGQKCPRCGAKIRKAGVHGHDAFYCPECQPDERQSGIVDFRKVKGP